MHRRAFLGGWAQARRPNVLLILADDLGSADLSCYGATDIRTPAIDALARDGLKLTQCYANPECTPTRAALLSGRYPQRFGGLECAIGLNNVGRYDEAIALEKRHELGLPPDAGMMARVFQANGYATAIFGKWHLGYETKFSPRQHGFDEHFGIEGGGADYFTHVEPEPKGRHTLIRNGQAEHRKGYLTDLIAQEALAWMARQREPWFLYVPFNAPHTPIQDPDVDGDPGKNGDRRRYVKMVERLDQRVGEILAKTPANTLVLFFSDNGGDPNGRNTPLRGRKSSAWEGGIRVPGLVKGPGVRGGVSAQVTHVMDVLPTLLKACRLKPPAAVRFDGVDQWPVWTGAKQPTERTLFWRYRRGAVTRKAVRQGPWKLVSDQGAEAVFDLAADPREEHDLMAEKPVALQGLRTALAEWEASVKPSR